MQFRKSSALPKRKMRVGFDEAKVEDDHDKPKNGKNTQYFQ